MITPGKAGIREAFLRTAGGTGIKMIEMKEAPLEILGASFAAEIVIYFYQPAQKRMISYNSAYWLCAEL